MIEHAIEHGGALDRAMAEHGGRREDWLDLSTGINPAPYALSEIAAEAWHRLPDSGAEARLIAAVRRAYGVPETLEVVAAPGTQALIQALPRLLDGNTATIVAGASGTYGEHAHCCAAAGRKVHTVASPEDVAVDESLVVLVNPNNPDGHVWSREELTGLAEQLRDGILVVDEAFCDATPEASVIPAARENIIVLRSFGKFFGLAGLRLGFAVCPPELAQRIGDWFGPWTVSGPALAIGAAALEDSQWIAATRSRLENDSSALAKLLERNRFSIIGRNALFVLARHDDATGIAQALARRYVLVRSFADRPTLLRFGLCADNVERERLMSALGEIMS
jgi:cobalamin biosynthetic protein CobC